MYYSRNDVWWLPVWTLVILLVAVWTFAAVAWSLPPWFVWRAVIGITLATTVLTGLYWLWDWWDDNGSSVRDWIESRHHGIK